MTSIQKLELIWERLVGEIHGFSDESQKFILNPSILRNLAMLKMIDIRLISADFNEDFVSFYPCLYVLLNSVSHIEFYGVYATDILEEKDINDDRNNQLEDIPHFCIRKVTWDQSKDITAFQLADDKEQYILSERQTSSKVIFLNSAQCPKIPQLISEAIQMVKQGLEFQKCQRTEVPYNELIVNISDNQFYFDFIYHPFSLVNNDLEEWSRKWCNYIDNLPTNISYIPDDKFRISYRLSLFDQINIFNKIKVN